MNNGNRLRKGRHSEKGNYYVITTITKHRAPIFKNFYSARIAINSLKNVDTLGYTLTLAYVLMPDHIHWMFQLKTENLAGTVKSFKQHSSKHIRDLYWQSGYYDQAIRNENNLRRQARYIIANPLRADIVKNIGDYPHWDAIYL